MATCGTVGYMVSSLAKELHGFPHKNRNLKTVSDEFDPTELSYYEGVFFSAGLFLVIGFILMAFACIYLCVRACCCNKEAPPGKSKGCNPVFLLICVLLCLGGLVLGYYGNEFTRDGMLGVASSVKSANGTVSSANTRVNLITTNLTGQSRLLYRLQLEIGNSSVPDPQKTNYVNQASQARGQVNSAADQSREISSSLESVPNVARYADDLKKYEDYRWRSTIGVLCYVLGILLLAVLCVFCKSVCMLQFNVFLTLIALIVAWLYGGVFIGVGVLGGDFCVDPDAYIDRAVSNSSREQVVYFTRCGNCSNPFENDFNTARDNLNRSIVQVASLTADVQAYRNFTSDNSTDQALTTLTELQYSLSGVDVILVNLFNQDINCTNLNNDYNDLLTSACKKTLDGAVFTFSGCFVLGVMLVMFIVASQLYWTRLKDEDKGW
eukprot:scpid67092/ scgid11962/ Protein tweety homolog 1